MKKLFLIATGVVFSMVVASAQVDSTRTKSKTQTQMNRKSDSTSFRSNSKDLVKVKSNEIPSSLRATFQDPQYKGWETGTVYHNAKTNEYSLQLTPMNSSSSTSSTTSTSGTNKGWYRFDSQGKLIPEMKKPNTNY